MEKIKINFTDFWPGFKKEDNFFLNLLSTKYDVELSDNPDFLIYSYRGQEFRNYKCIRIKFLGENIRPDFKECDFAFSFDFLPDNPNNFRLPLYALYDDMAKLVNKRRDYKEILKTKTKFCCFVVSNKFAPERNKFFRLLSKYKRVDSGGRFMNNIGGPVENKVEFLKEYKFAIAFENSSYPGYTTEKILEPLLVDSIPIYWGNPLVYKDFNTNCFINCHDYKNMKEVIEKIIELDNNDDLLKDYLTRPIFPNNELPEYVDNKNILQQFDYIFKKANEITPVGTIYTKNKKIQRYLLHKTKRAKMKLKYYFKEIL
jgi:hypothetical protein